MPWWTMIPRPEGKSYEQHATQKDAGIAILFAANFGGVNPGDCGMYARDPRLHQSEQNILPALIAKADRQMKRKYAKDRARE